jgi:hypothetical protein
MWKVTVLYISGQKAGGPVDTRINMVSATVAFASTDSLPYSEMLPQTSTTRRSHGIASPTGTDTSGDSVPMRNGACHCHTPPTTRGSRAPRSTCAPPTPRHIHSFDAGCRLPLLRNNGLIACRDAYGLSTLPIEPMCLCGSHYYSSANGAQISFHRHG